MVDGKCVLVYLLHRLMRHAPSLLAPQQTNPKYIDNKRQGWEKVIGQFHQKNQDTRVLQKKRHIYTTVMSLAQLTDYGSEIKCQRIQNTCIFISDSKAVSHVTKNDVVYGGLNILIKFLKSNTEKNLPFKMIVYSTALSWFPTLYELDVLHLLLDW